MKAKLAPIYFDPGRDQEFDLQCRHLERHLADDAELLEPTALGSGIPDADAVIFPQLFGEAFKRIEDMDLAGAYCFLRYGKGNSCYSRLIESFDGTTLNWNDDSFYSSKYTGEDGRKGSPEVMNDPNFAKRSAKFDIHPRNSEFFLAGALMVGLAGRTRHQRSMIGAGWGMVSQGVGLLVYDVYGMVATSRRAAALRALAR